MTLPFVRPASCLIAAGLLMCAASCTRSETPIQAKTNDAESSGIVVPVVAVSRSDIASATVITAEFQPFQEVDVMAKVAGYVRSIKVDLGDHVREGQVLAELEIPEMNDDIARASAVVDQTGAEIAAGRDELQRAESTHQIAHLSYTRLLEVTKREPGLIPQQELDEVHSRDLIAEAQVAAAKSRLRVGEQKTAVAKADAARMHTLRNYVTIPAPFTGVVTKRYANTGSMIQAGIASQSQAMPLVRLSQNSTLRLSLPVPESLVPTVRVGQAAEVHVQSLQRAFPGRVARFAGKVDLASRTMITEVDVPNPTGVILPGMYAEVNLQTKEHKGVLTAPLEALERTGSAVRVFTINTSGDKSGTVKIVPVQLGLEDAHRAEILSGVEEGQLVITGRRAGVSNGERVRFKIMEPGE